eukprot:6415672-Amphidinium_carterae.2
MQRSKQQQQVCTNERPSEIINEEVMSRRMLNIMFKDVLREKKELNTLRFWPQSCQSLHTVTSSSPHVRRMVRDAFLRESRMLLL